MTPELRGLPYEKRLDRLRLPSLQERRERGDLIMMYKIVNGKEKTDKEDIIIRDKGKTREYKYKLKKIRGLKDVKKHSFSNRSLAIWNSLDEEVVGARNIHTFKSKLDKGRYKDRTTRA